MQNIRKLSHKERVDWLRLIRSENVGPVTFFQLLKRYGDAKTALAAIPDLARRGGMKRRIRIAAAAAAESECERLTAYGAELIACCEPEYPHLLRHIPDPPPLVSVKGHTSLFPKTVLGIVGARNASAVAVRFARQIASDLAADGIVIASGLARGIDAAAHEGSLANGTIAFLGGGIDIPYPPENTDLHERIGDLGCLVAEQPIGTQPQARHFPRRNRLISGVSTGVLVVEATPKSGSLITARMALEQGREVFAVPGSPLDPRARGTNDLIRQGARLVESASDILDALNGLSMGRIREPERTAPDLPPLGEIDEHALEEARGRIAGSLSPTPVEVDEIVRQSRLTPAVVLTILLELELAGRLERHAGGRVSLA